MEKLIDRVMTNVERNVAGQQAMPLSQVSSGTVDLECDEGSLAEEPKTAGLSTKENLKLELSAVLGSIGVDKSSTGVVTAASAGVAPDGGSQLVGDASGSCE
ncbi:hypothetical protein AXG93_2381s1200 [Marchantia polymorpha subsp. ruderalis]|uniref:Uncharacterized protein n=1 Tax=Marchantia polymorpha subsp. ruderalis TaxID=1480154 RepID=A0A176VND3_MARPO|nr:hypothetical protein AXG93_2381s1200 [Marchantia polymorpha subsp. ruderalis]